MKWPKDAFRRTASKLKYKRGLAKAKRAGRGLVVNGDPLARACLSVLGEYLFAQPNVEYNEVDSGPRG